ncbi:hypothetical protein E1B28_002939 [Marasmius oreades]|uniref:F-box domain-containing protein n=1 Tax=Marasmius oreades TaxID=181124 RepID=A0A9P7RJG7_9AGAR|nr:uncharacterized protein E1B28_002939 [Marasmius oreades]KAG7085376.1 hypothetical protein E1B28_002939 [Marasmius oreades]
MESVSPTVLCPGCNATFIPLPSFPGVDFNHLRANITPSSTEKSHEIEVLEKEWDQLGLYDKELECLDEIARKLKKERNLLAVRISKRKSWLAAIRRLPVEILADIFSRVCSTQAKTLSIFQLPEEPDDAHYVISPPLTLSHVSYYWRRVAISCPHLWSSIQVDVTQPFSSFDGILSTYLTNSASQPLDITIFDTGESHFAVLDYREEKLGVNGVAILDTLLSQSFRIEDLTFYNFNLDFGLPEIPQCTFPLLRSFHTNTGMAFLDTWFVRALAEAPLLDSVSAVFVDEVLPISYSLLTSLTMQSTASLSYFHDPLQKCSNLRSLHIMDYVNVRPEDEAKPLELPSLRYFSFRAEALPSICGNLPHCIKFPSLYEIDLTYLGFDGDGVRVERGWPCPGFSSILQSCSSTLRRLSIAFPRHALTDAAARQILELSPSVTQLEIRLGEDVAGFMETLLSVLRIPDSSDGRTFSIAVPQLTTLIVTINHGAILLTEKIGRLMVDMVSSRSRKILSKKGRFINASALTKACFDFGDPPTPHAEATLEILEASRRFLEIMNEAQLDPDINFWCVAFPFDLSSRKANSNGYTVYPSTRVGLLPQ